MTHQCQYPQCKDTNLYFCLPLFLAFVSIINVNYELNQLYFWKKKITNVGQLLLKKQVNYYTNKHI